MADSDSASGASHEANRPAKRLRQVAVRADPERRAAERARNTAARREARTDPERRAAERARNTAARRQARADPARRAAERARNTAARRQARTAANRNQEQEQQPLLLDRLGDLMRFDYLHGGKVVELPDYLTALPDERVQNLPGGQLPVERQVPYEVHMQLASSMAAALTRRMPSRVCAVCSELCSEEQSAVYAFGEIPNVELLRADIMCTDAVPRWGHTLAWRRMPCTPEGTAPPPPEPVLPMRYRRQQSGRQQSDVAKDGDDDGDEEPSDDDIPEEQLPPELRPRPPRILPRPCSDDAASVDVPYCMRLEPELPNRTMYACAVAGVDKIYVCSDCDAALSGTSLRSGLGVGKCPV